MTRNEEHVSMFELDLYFATRERNAALEAHVEGCADCAGYLKTLAALQETVAMPLPSARPPASAPAVHEARRRRRWTTLGAALSLAAAVVALLAFEPGQDAVPAVAVKGSPAVQLLVRRGEQTRVWDGSSHVRPGDVLGLRVACEEFSTVTVAAGVREGWTQLADQACPAQAKAALPFTLVVDAEPGRERLAVVFSKVALGESALSEAVRAVRRDGSVWVTRLELDKEVAR